MPLSREPLFFKNGDLPLSREPLFFKNGDLGQRVRALVFSARRRSCRSWVRAPVGPGTFLHRNIIIGPNNTTIKIAFSHLRPFKLYAINLPEQ
jgi:hypothetical protein